VKERDCLEDMGVERMKTLKLIKVCFFHQLMHKSIVFKTILKFTLKLTLKRLRHISMQSHHHQGVTVVKIAISTTVTLASTSNAFPDYGVTAPKHVGAVLLF
jgi:hypothetical protein